MIIERHWMSQKGLNFHIARMQGCLAILGSRNVIEANTMLWLVIVGIDKNQ